MDLPGNQRSIKSLGDNGVAATTNRIGPALGIYQTSYLNGTAATQGRNAALEVFANGLLGVASLPALRPASYSASSAFACSSTTDNTVVPGNATNTILVTRVKVSCTQTTAGTVTLTLVKRSTADSGGTSAAMTARSRLTRTMRRQRALRCPTGALARKWVQPWATSTITSWAA